MKIFLDTSVLVKLYHQEDETDALDLFFSTSKITAIYLSEITKIEFESTFWKKVRTKELSEPEALRILEIFERDSFKYLFTPTDTIVIERARVLISNYGIKGLRTLDAIQLATAVLLSPQVDLFLTSDNLLKLFFEIEKLKTGISN